MGPSFTMTTINLTAFGWAEQFYIKMLKYLDGNKIISLCNAHGNRKQFEFITNQTQHQYLFLICIIYFYINCAIINGAGYVYCDYYHRLNAMKVRSKSILRQEYLELQAYNFFSGDIAPQFSDTTSETVLPKWQFVMYPRFRNTFPRPLYSTMNLCCNVISTYFFNGHSFRTTYVCNSLEFCPKKEPLFCVLTSIPWIKNWARPTPYSLDI